MAAGSEETVRFLSSGYKEWVSEAFEGSWFLHNGNNGQNAILHYFVIKLFINKGVKQSALSHFAIKNLVKWRFD